MPTQRKPALILKRVSHALYDCTIAKCWNLDTFSLLFFLLTPTDTPITVPPFRLTNYDIIFLEIVLSLLAFGIFWWVRHDMRDKHCPHEKVAQDEESAQSTLSTESDYSSVSYQHGINIENQA